MNQVVLLTKLRLWRFIAAASVVLLLLSIGIDFFKTDSSVPVWIESKTPAGGLTNLRLSDGTIVALNASSSLSYPLTFEEKNRTVRLEGEAYFDVAEDSGHPFVIETNQMKIEVLGTRFNTKCYDGDKELITTLLEGSVNIVLNNLHTNENTSFMLVPGQQIIVDKTTNRAKISRVNPELYVAWKDDQCFFENERLIDITRMLERQFGVMINIVSPNLENQLYSGFFTKKEGIQQILNSFRRNRKFDYRWNDTGIEIFEK